MTEHLCYTQHYGTDYINWIGGKENNMETDISMMNEGKVTLNLKSATEDGNFSNMRFYSLAGGKQITITSVKLTK